MTSEMKTAIPFLLFSIKFSNEKLMTQKKYHWTVVSQLDGILLVLTVVMISQGARIRKKEGYVIPTILFVKIGIAKIFCYNNKMFGSINKTFGCCGKIFGCSNKNFICCPYSNFVAVTKPFFPWSEGEKRQGALCNKRTREKGFGEMRPSVRENCSKGWVEVADQKVRKRMFSSTLYIEMTYFPLRKFPEGIWKIHGTRVLSLINTLSRLFLAAGTKQSPLTDGRTTSLVSYIPRPTHSPWLAEPFAGFPHP